MPRGHTLLGAFWPDWLSAEFPRVRFLSLNFPTNLFGSFFEGGGQSLVQRAYSTLELLKTHGIGKRPVIFITHSLGGLLAKAYLRKESDLNGSDESELLNNVAAIVFLATPHSG